MLIGLLADFCVNSAGCASSRQRPNIARRSSTMPRLAARQALMRTSQPARAEQADDDERDLPQRQRALLETGVQQVLHEGRNQQLGGGADQRSQARRHQSASAVHLK